MGIIFSRFRKQPTTLEKLKKIEEGLRKIEDYKRTTEQKQKRTVANLVIYGVALYVLACVIVFVWFLPESWLVRLGLLVPLVLVPFIIYWMKRLISKYFDSKMLRANEDYKDLQRKKKDLIDSIMETETFNKAKEILSRYAPEKLEKKETAVSTGTLAINPTADLRKRNTTVTNPPTTKMDWIAPVDSYWKPHQTAPVSKVEPVTSSPICTSIVSQFKLPQPLFPKNRSLGEKLVEYIVGDGPTYRYALICKFCREHNGMALQEEFPYMSFACCYCRKMNPARISRPTAPRLPEPEKPREILGIQSSVASINNDARFPNLKPFDKYVHEVTQEPEDTEESTETITASTSRISNTEINESSVKDTETSEPEDTCRNTSGKEDDFDSSSREDIHGDSELSDDNGKQTESNTRTLIEDSEISKSNYTGKCDSTNS